MRSALAVHAVAIDIALSELERAFMSNTRPTPTPRYTEYDGDAPLRSGGYYSWHRDYVADFRTSCEALFGAPLPVSVKKMLQAVHHVGIALSGTLCTLDELMSFSARLRNNDVYQGPQYQNYAAYGPIFLLVPEAVSEQMLAQALTEIGK